MCIQEMGVAIVMPWFPPSCQLHACGIPIMWTLAVAVTGCVVVDEAEQVYVPASWGSKFVIFSCRAPWGVDIRPPEFTGDPFFSHTIMAVGLEGGGEDKKMGVVRDAEGGGGG